MFKMIDVGSNENIKPKTHPRILDSPNGRILIQIHVHASRIEDSVLPGDRPAGGSRPVGRKMMNHQFSRRQFVRTFMITSAAAPLLTEPWSGTLVADLAPAASTAGVVRIKISDFPPLQQDRGSLRLGVTPVYGPTPNSSFYPILINRSSATVYYALDSRCPHRFCVVPPFDRSANVVHCFCHGAEFGLDGTLLLGPATAPLKRYPIEFDGLDTLTIQVPEFGYTVTVASVQTPAGPRVRLEFPTILNAVYQLESRPSLQAAWNPIAFSRTAEGELTDTSLTGSGNAATVYVDQPDATGFYRVSFLVIQV